MTTTPAAPDDDAGALVDALVGAVHDYFFSYASADMMRAIEAWQRLRPSLVEPNPSYTFRLSVRGWKVPAAIKILARTGSSTVTRRRLHRAHELGGAPGFAMTGRVADLHTLDALLERIGGDLHSFSWAIEGSRDLPFELLSQLDRLQRVLEWTCDFEAAHAIYPRTPSIGFDSTRAGIFILASRWQRSLRASAGWALLDIHRPGFHQFEAGPATATQALFVEADESHVVTEGVREVPVPRRAYALVADAEVFGGGTVVTADGLLDYDPAQRSVYDFVAGRWDHVAGSAATLERAAVRLPAASAARHPAGILVGGRADMNWYHWMIEHLSRLMAVDDILDPELPVVVSDRLAPPAWDAVRAATRRRIIVAPVDQRTLFDSLYVLSNSVLHRDTLELPWSAGTSIDWGLVDKLAGRIVAAHGTVDEGSPRRIFWYRESTHRNLTNQAELVEVAQRWGFTVIHPEECTLADQVRLFQNADAVISAMGAVTPNYLFMRPGSHIISMTSRASADYIFPGVIGAHATGSFRTLVGNFAAAGDERGKLDYFHLPFHIAPHLLEDELSRLLG